MPRLFLHAITDEGSKVVQMRECDSDEVRRHTKEMEKFASVAGYSRVGIGTCHKDEPCVACEGLIERIGV